MRSLVLGLLLFAACAAHGTSPVVGPESPADALLEQFKVTPLVAIAEQHRSRQVHQFLRDLLSDPGFPGRVQDIVVEFGSGYYQPVIDRYVNGEEVPREELRQVWRDTGQWMVWDSPLYERFFEAVRARNASLPAGRRIRVLLGDPPIHWPDVRTAEDYRKFADRDACFADVVEREVLGKGRRALLIIGGMHLLKQGPMDSTIAGSSPGVAEIVSRRHPGSLFVVWTLPPSPEAPAALGMEGARSFLRLRGSGLERESFARLVPAGVSVRRVVAGESRWVPMGELPWPPMSDVVDALLYLGADPGLVDPDPAIYREPAYQAELRRRAVILGEVYGLDFITELEQLLVDPSPDTGR